MGDCPRLWFGVQRCARMITRRAALAGLAAVAAGGCSRERAVARTARRIVSLSPSTTEALFAVGAGSRLVGRSRYCDYPPEVLRLPQVGGYVDPSFEAIFALRPDLVRGARGPAGAAVADRFSSRGVATYFPSTETFVEIDEMILGLGVRTETQPRARDVVTELHARLERLELSLVDQPVVRALLVFGLEPIVVAGPGSFPDEMLRHARATNAVTQGGRYPTLGIERVLALDPDVVLNATMAEQHSADRIGPNVPGWSKVGAVRRGRVVAIADETVLRPGPRVVEGLEVLARVLH